ncbi:hypothetical protein EVAR_27962_1 [Eumeta japonica]|uniref:Uncharacterized protein n=1 Tax=Eumeta variegata TaxID=151549 RepID=A0A4C1ZRI7_EUMVA|nr:hypothetical protein EVAR_27962_1 [Eumeta japonica]
MYMYSNKIASGVYPKIPQRTSEVGSKRECTTAAPLQRTCPRRRPDQSCLEFREAAVVFPSGCAAAARRRPPRPALSVQHQQGPDRARRDDGRNRAVSYRDR